MGWKLREGWFRLTPGFYIHDEYGTVWKEGRTWACSPTGSITRSPFDAAHSAMAECEREASLSPQAKRRMTVLRRVAELF